MATRVEEAQDLLRESRGAMAATRWDEARVAAERAALLDPDDPQILEAWGEAAFVSGHRKSTFDAGERAFRRYRDLGDDLGSARVAILIASASYDHGRDRDRRVQPGDRAGEDDRGRDAEPRGGQGPDGGRRGGGR
ncbi:MAG: hypothetical protein M3138_09655 [Actinomycetota bacterium]|nr:hypothetical protein [Actinomycetota bacterium]